MSEDREAFLSRWSRRKLDARAQPAGDPRPAAQPEPAPPAAKESEAPPLPAPETLGLDSDFSAFMRAKVDEGVRRTALKKLFADPHFNVMDGLDTYIEDYNLCEPVSAEMLAGLTHSRSTLFPEAGKDRAPAQETAAAPPVAAAAPAEVAKADPQSDEAGKHDAPGQDA